MAGPDRFQALPLVTLLDALADAFEWPRSRPARVLTGDRAQLVKRVALCTSEAALDALDPDVNVAGLLATPPARGAALGGGRRVYDPFVATGDQEDVGSWRRAARPVLDAALLVAGGRGGLDERLSQAVGLLPGIGHRHLQPVRPMTLDVVKVVVYVPVDHADAVCRAMWSAGAGQLGNYDQCSFRAAGTGTFRPLDGATPTVGTVGSLELADELRCEVVVPMHLLRRVLDAARRAHPYEEVALDVVDMRLPAAVGFGRAGRLGAGGGAEAWSVLGALDETLTVHGRADRVPDDATCAVHVGALRDVLGPLLDLDDVQLVIASTASDAELELLAARGSCVMLIDRARVLDAYASEIAGHLTRRMTMPVARAGGLRFPDASEPAAESSPASSSRAGSAERPTAASAPAAAASAPAAAASAPAAAASGTWRLHFDGGSRGNPGPAAYGWVLYDPSGAEADADGVRVGRATNNVAEWTGLLRGLEHASQLGIRVLEVRGDSELVVKQVTGVYRVKNASLKPLADAVKDVMRRFDRVQIAHVYRSDNARADELANEALDGVR